MNSGSRAAWLRSKPATNNYAHLEDSEFERIKANFATEEELGDIRDRLVHLDDQLESAVERQDFSAAARLRDERKDLREKDPKWLYFVLEEALKAAIREERYTDAARLRDQLLVVRRHLPQFNLAGLWKGQYGDYGETIIRIRYEGEMMVATKVTGDPHVPAGEVTFRANLSSNDVESVQSENSENVRLEVIEVGPSDEMVTKEVEEFSAEGVIATRNYEHVQFVPGRLFLLSPTTIGFLWMSIGQFVHLERLEEDPEQDPVNAMRKELKNLMQYKA